MFPSHGSTVNYDHQYCTMSSSSNTNSDTHDRSSLSRLGSLRSLRNSATATALAAAQRLESLHPELRQAYERVLKNDRPEQQHVEEDFYINITMKGEPLPSSAESHTDADETYVSSGTDYDDESIKVAKIVEDTTRSNKEEHKDDEEPMIVHRVDSSYGADVDKVDSVMDDSPCESSIEQEKPGLLRCSSAPSCPAAHIMITEEVRRINEVVIVEEGAQENTMVNKSAPTTTTTTPPSTVATIESQPEEPLLPTNDDERAKEVTDEKAASTTDEQPEEEPLQTDEEEPLKDDESEEEAPISREPPGILATQEACWVDETSTEYSEDESSQTPFYIEDEEEKDGGMSFEELISPQQSYFSEVQELSSNEIDEDAVIDSSQQPGGAKLSDDDASSVAAGKTGYDVDCQDEASGLYQAEDAISVELNYDNNADHDAEADGLVAVMLKDSVTKEDLARAARTTTSIAPVIKRTDKETTNSNSAAALPQPEKTKVEVETNDKPQSNSSSAANVRSTTVECQEKLQEEKKKAAVKPEKKESVQERCNSSPKKNKPNKYPVAYGQSARKSTSKKTKTVKRTGPVDLDVSWHSNSSETTEFILNDLQEDRLLEEYEASIAAAAKIETNSEEHKKCRTLLASAATTTIHTAEAPKRSEVLESSVAIVESNADASIQKVKHAGKRETRERSMAKVAPTAEASIPKAEPPLPTEFESRERQLNDSSLRSMPLEAVLMRRFDLKFQEAASLVADARINMGGGSPSWVPWTNELYEECEKLYKLKYCGDDEHEEEKVVIMNWPKFLAPVDGLRAPTHADFASSSGNSTDSAASSCLESSTGWSSVWDGRFILLSILLCVLVHFRSFYFISHSNHLFVFLLIE